MFWKGLGKININRLICHEPSSWTRVIILPTPKLTRPSKGKVGYPSKSTRDIYQHIPPIYGLYDGCIGQYGVILGEQLLGYTPKGTQHFPLNPGKELNISYPTETPETHRLFGSDFWWFFLIVPRRFFLEHLHEKLLANPWKVTILLGIKLDFFCGPQKIGPNSKWPFAEDGWEVDPISNKVPTKKIQNLNGQGILGVIPLLGFPGSYYPWLVNELFHLPIHGIYEG